MKAEQIFPGLEYAVLVTDDAPLVRFEVTEKAMDDLITGRFFVSGANIGGPPVILSPDRIVTTWEDAVLRRRSKATVNETHYFISGLIVGSVAVAFLAATLALILTL